MIGLTVWFNTSLENEILKNKSQLGVTVTADIIRSIETIFIDQITIAEMTASQPSISALCLNPDDHQLYKEVWEQLNGFCRKSEEYENVFIIRFGGAPVEIELEDGTYRIPDGGIMVSSVGNHILGDGADKDWSAHIRAGKDFYIGKPYLSMASGTPITVLTVPVRSDGKVVGAVGLATKLDFITDKFFKQKDFIDDEYVFMFDDAGDMISHPDKEAILTERGRTIAGVFMEHVKNNDFQFEERSNDSLNYYFGSELDFGADMGSVWYLFYREPVGKMMASVERISRISVVLISVIGLFISALITISTRRMILAPLNIVKRELEDISKGGGDLTEKIKISSDNEIGEIGRSFNNFTDTLKNMIIRIKDSVSANRSLRDRLAASTEETSASVNQIMNNISSIKNMMDNLLAESNEANDSTSEINENIQILTEQAGVQSAAVQQSMAAVEEMITSLKSMAQITARQKERSDNLAKGAEHSGFMLDETYNSIVKVNTNIDSIMEMTNVIDNIANQTNLLAMNAAIEAAHAGEAGKGFAVVADEIRKLSEDSSTSSSRIAMEVKNIIEQMKLSADNSNSLQEIFNGFLEDIRSTAEAFSEINAGTIEMSSGSDQILQAMASLTDMAEKLSEAAGNMQNGTAVVSSNIGSVLELSQSTNSAIEEIALGSNEIIEAMSDMHNNVHILGEQAKELSTDVDSFKTA